MPILHGAAQIIHREEPHSRFIICTANAAVAGQIDRFLKTRCTREGRCFPALPIEVEHQKSHAVLERCDLSLTCSGTATLEAAVLGVPMVVMYRIHHWLDRVLAFCKAYRGGYRFVSLPNCLLKRAVLPELLNGELSSERAAAEGLALLRDPSRRRAQADGFEECRTLLGPPGAIRRAADLVESLLDGRGCLPFEL
jgi:lipid-A-disaccharide synthase